MTEQNKNVRTMILRFACDLLGVRTLCLVSSGVACFVRAGVLLFRLPACVRYRSATWKRPLGTVALIFMGKSETRESFY